MKFVLLGMREEDKIEEDKQIRYEMPNEDESGQKLTIG